MFLRPRWETLNRVIGHGRSHPFTTAAEKSPSGNTDWLKCKHHWSNPPPYQLYTSSIMWVYLVTPAVCCVSYSITEPSWSISASLRCCSTFTCTTPRWASAAGWTPYSPSSPACRWVPWHRLYHRHHLAWLALPPLTIWRRPPPKWHPIPDYSALLLYANVTQIHETLCLYLDIIMTTYLSTTAEDC